MYGEGKEEDKGLEGKGWREEGGKKDLEAGPLR